MKSHNEHPKFKESDAADVRICALLNQLGVTANYIGFFHTACAVAFCMEDPASAGHEVGLSGGSQGVSYKLAGSGTEHPNSDPHRLAGEPPLTGTTGPPSPGEKALRRPASCHPLLQPAVG